MNNKGRLAPGLALNILLILAFLYLFFAGYVSYRQFELYLLDSRLKVRRLLSLDRKFGLKIPVTQDVVVVAIDDESLSEYGRWPWQRDIHAKLINALKALGAKTITYDIEFIEPSRKVVSDAVTGIDIPALFREVAETFRTTLRQLLEKNAERGITQDLSEELDRLITRTHEEYIRIFNDGTLDPDRALALAMRTGTTPVILGTSFPEPSHIQRELFVKKLVEYIRKNGPTAEVDLSLKQNPYFTEDYERARFIYLLENSIDAGTTEARMILGIDEKTYHGLTKYFKECEEMAIRNVTFKLLEANPRLGESALLEKVKDKLNLREATTLNVVEKTVRDSYRIYRSYLETGLIHGLPAFETGFQETDFWNPPVHEILMSAAFIGNTSTTPDPDGIYRHVPGFVIFNGNYYFPLSLATLIKHMNIPRDGIKVVPGQYIYLKSSPSSDGKTFECRVPLDKQNNIFVNWVRTWEDSDSGNSWNIVSASRVLAWVNMLEVDDRNLEELMASDYIVVDFSMARYRKLKAKAFEDSLSETEEIEFAELRTKMGDAWKSGEEYLRGQIELLERRLESLKDKPEKLARAERLLRTWKGMLENHARALNKKEDLKKFFEGKMVFIGLSAYATADIKPSSLEPTYPMCGIHPTIINSCLNNYFLTKWNRFYDTLIILGSGFITAMAGLKGGYLSASLALFIVLLGNILFSFYLCVFNGIWTELFTPLVVTIGCYALTMVYRYAVEEKEKRFLRFAFSHYLSDHMIAEMLKNPEKLGLHGERRRMTVLFSDVRGFTTFSESRTPEEVVAALNEYLDVMTNVIQKHGGTLDKYVGDEIMALFGAPVWYEDHALRSVKVGLEMLEELKKLQEKWVAEGKTALDIGIGVNTGEMVVGNMGSKNYFDYTVIGDNVNLGARVEALTRKYNNHFIITEFTYEDVKDYVEVRYLDSVKVKGKNKPVAVYDVVGLKEKPGPPYVYPPENPEITVFKDKAPSGEDGEGSKEKEHQPSPPAQAGEKTEFSPAGENNKITFGVTECGAGENLKAESSCDDLTIAAMENLAIISGDKGNITSNEESDDEDKPENKAITPLTNAFDD